jgi:hypothetical protein
MEKVISGLYAEMDKRKKINFLLKKLRRKNLSYVLESFPKGDDANVP